MHAPTSGPASSERPWRARCDPRFTRAAGLIRVVAQHRFIKLRSTNRIRLKHGESKPHRPILWRCAQQVFASPLVAEFRIRQTEGPVVGLSPETA